MYELSVITEQKSIVTMSSREIAELCEKRHDNVLKLVRDLIDGGLLKNTTPHKYQHTQNNQFYTEYLSDKRDSLVIVARLSPEFTAAIVDRWQELENQQSPLIPQTLPEALRLAADLAEQNQALQLESKQKSEQIESMESYFRNGISPFEFVKGLNGVNSLKVGAFLVDKNWLYQDGNHERVKAYARDQYLTEETTEISQHGKDPFWAYKPVLLKKGAAKLYEWYTQGKLPMKSNWKGEFTQDKAVGL